MNSLEQLLANKNTRSILIAGGTLLAAAFGLLLAGYINQNITGEAYYDFHYPDRFSLLPSIKVFFFNRVQSRLMHAVFVSLIYELIGFNPPLLNLTVFILTILSSVFITLILRDYIKSPVIAILLVLTFALLPLNIPELVALKKLHHTLAWFAFWLAALFGQLWIISRNRKWLLVSGIAITVSLLSYEATAALLPITVLLSSRYIHNLRHFIKTLLALVSVNLLAVLVFFGVESLKSSGRISNIDLGATLSFSGVAQRLWIGFSQLAQAIWHDGLFSVFFAPQATSSMIAKLVIAISLLLAITGALRAMFHSNQDSQGESRLFLNPSAALLLAGLWLSFATYIPFFLANQPPDSDSMRGAAYALILIMLAAYLWLKSIWGNRISNVFVGLICIFWIGTGIISYANGIELREGDDRLLNNFIYSLKQEIPYVKENTIFIYVNASLGRTGCIGMMNMLYSRDKLQCIHLMDTDKLGSYSRLEGMLKEDSGEEYEENFIILTFDELGYVTIIEELNPTSHPSAPILWEDSTPIVTNPNRVLMVADPGSRVSQFYDYMIERRVQMGWLESP